MKRSVTTLPLHYGRAPRWLFDKMKRLSAAIASLIVIEFGPRELLRRLADPIWFQAFGCVVGFDWHSSGLTTTLCGAIKDGLLSHQTDLSLAVCGGKAARSRHTPQELAAYGEAWGIDVSPFVALSRLVAKIDNGLIQDGYNIYHHTFILTRDGDWAVIQQGMNEETRTARRYQWFSREEINLLCEPHTGVTCDEQGRPLNLVAAESAPAHSAILDFVSHHPDRMAKMWQEITLALPERHYIAPADVDARRLGRMFRTLHESGAKTFKELIQTPGVGPRTIAALSLVSELVYDAPPSFKDPARFSFAHGGKDGHPFPVDRKTYEESITFLQSCLDTARVADREKIEAFKRLSRYTGSRA
jgi:uncharacterized protein